MTDFSRPEDRELAVRFLRDGHVIAPTEDADSLNRMQARIVELACEFLKTPKPEGRPEDRLAFLNGVGSLIPESRLNDFRLFVIDGIGRTDWFRLAYFETARSLIETIVGNELCMQRRINLSIQLPQDASSLLPVHSDTWSGDSPFEVVLWIPLVDCFATKSMYLLPPAPATAFDRDFKKRAGASAEDIFRAMEPDLRWMEVPYGSVLLFNQNLPHGNRVNREAQARWTMNCRFKSVFSPYMDKKLGEFFEPITLRPATRAGMAYTPPEKFEE